MTTALAFGFAHLFVPGTSFERLHIFLFNLCSGGTIILYFTEGQENVSKKVMIFYCLALLYAFCAFFEFYFVSILIAWTLCALVESIRRKHFSTFPSEFFQKEVTVSKKFHQASLLCLSIGLIISSIAICNQEYFTIVSSPKLVLDTFFLGFSFPLSLITMSVMFSMMEKNATNFTDFFKTYCFWAINGGVIIFFIFILLQWSKMELVISSVLFCTIGIILYLYTRMSDKKQQKAFLTSGICFLILTAITGIIDIALYYSPNKSFSEFILRLHTITSLYGWNLSGLAVICRFKDFPIRLHSGKVIALHWLIVIFLAPLAYYYKIFAIAAIVSYGVFLYILFFSKGLEISNND